VDLTCISPYPGFRTDASLWIVQELARRCDTLIRLVEKENEEMEAAEREERKKGVKKAGPRASESLGTGATPGSMGGPGLLKKRKMSTGGGPAEKRKRGGAT
jgi:SWI/SNF-related matrix-associated actin-dependent regulator of chromatin subfamily A member 5